MEKLDEALEKRVWQRIHGQSLAMGLQSLAAAEQSQAAVYLMLSRLNQSTHRPLLRQLYEREKDHGRCINGISLLRDGRELTVHTAPPVNERPDTALRKCYAQTLRAIQAYRQLEEDEEYGHVFRVLRHQEEENCALILQLIGR